MNKSNEKSYDVLIVGAGASGVICAITAAKRNLKVALIDGNLFPAKKILVTGNGRCNLTNKYLTSKNYNRNIDQYLRVFNNESTLEFFNNIGVETYYDEEGRCYPISNSSKSVVEALNFQIKKLGVDFYGESLVDQVKVSDSNYEIVLVNKVKLCAQKLVLATGGNSIINLLNDFKIKLVKINPSLVSLKTVESTKPLDGIRLKDVLVKASCGSDNIEEKGEVLFKDHGLSGIVIFNLSSLFARKKQFSGEVQINLLPNYNFCELKKMLKSRTKIFDKVSNLFIGLFNKQIANEIIKRSGVNSDKSVNDLSDLDLEKIAKIISQFGFKINGSYDNNQVYSGGVELEELKSNLEHKKYKNLFFCGEICDVDGVCGGYNLQWAFTSGHIVGESL